MMLPAGGSSHARVAIATALLLATVATPAAAESPPGGNGLFSVDCDFSHRLSDDPIVFPGKAGASHSHDFLGNTSTDADSTLDSLRARGTACHRPADKSAYWVPTLYERGVPVTPSGSTIYYRTGHRQPSSIVPFPAGLRVIAGDAKSEEMPDDGVVHWSCQHGNRTGERDRELQRSGLIKAHRQSARHHQAVINRHRAALRRARANGSKAAVRRHKRTIRHHTHMRHEDLHALDLLLSTGPATVPTCKADETLHLSIAFQDCWDGKNPDSSDHQLHMAYSDRREQQGQVCPAGHPVAVPAVQLNLHYPTGGGSKIALASGSGNTAHADFFNAWDDAGLAALVTNCLKADVYCGSGNSGHK